MPDDNIKSAATIAAVAAAASAATAAAKLSVDTSIALVSKDISYIKDDVSEIKGTLKEMSRNFVTRDEFFPIRILTYGQAGLLLTATIGAILANVFIKH